MEKRLSLSPPWIFVQGIDWTTPGLTSSLRFEAEIGVCGTSLLLNLWTLPDISRFGPICVAFRRQLLMRK